MSELIGRRYRLTIDDLQGTRKIIESQPPPAPSLRVTFHIEKDLQPRPNKFSVAVYNLAAGSRDALPPERANILLEAGYEGEFGTILNGQSRRISSVKDGPDWITSIDGGDGETTLQGFRMNESFPPKAKLVTILTRFLEKLGGDGRISVKNAIKRVKDDDFRGGLQELEKGLTTSGPAFAEMQRQFINAGLGFSIQDGEATVLADNETTQDDIIVFSENSGLIGSPKRDEIEIKGTKTIRTSFKSLLIPSVRPGLRARLQSREFPNTTLKLTKVTYLGDTHANDPWYVNPEGIDLGAA